MHRLTRSVIAVAATGLATAPAAMFAICSGIAGASPHGTDEAARVPLTGILRRCDFSDNMYTGPTGYGRAFALISTTPSNNVVAEVSLATAVPNTHYDVRLIQVPRPSWLTCVAGDPGTAVGALHTDAAGAAAVTLQDDIEPGATGAWVFISRPDAHSQTPAEFYTSDFVAAI
jgi:hypothetical protein